MPENFAERVLDLELKIDGGKFDLKNVDELINLYSVSIYFHLIFNFYLQSAVEYYSGMNDEKYMHFTERIQNTLLKPEIVKLYD